jgi:phage baseplate assembly protein W
MAVPTTRRFNLESTWSTVLADQPIPGNARVHQSSAFDSVNGHIFVVQIMPSGVKLIDEDAALSGTIREQRGDLMVTRLNAAGAQTGRMYVRGAGHGWGVTAEPVEDETFLWMETAAVRDGTYAWGTQVGRFRFVDNGLVDSGNSRINDPITQPDPPAPQWFRVPVESYDPVPGMLRVTASVDVSTNRIIVHYKDANQGRFFLMYALGDFLARDFAPISGFATNIPAGNTYHNFVLWGRYLYELEGSYYVDPGNLAPGNTYVVVSDVSTGALVERVHQVQQPQLEYREPETLAVRSTADGMQLVLGFALGDAGARRIVLYAFEVLAPDPETPSTRRFDLQAKAQKVMDPFILHEVGAPQQIAFNRLDDTMFVSQVIQGGRQFPGESEAKTYAERGADGDICVTRLDAAGVITGHMFLLGMGHGTSLGVEVFGGEVYLWTEAAAVRYGTYGYGTKVGRTKFVDGAVVTSSDAAVQKFDPVSGDRVVLNAIDIPTRRILVRHTEAPPAKGISYTLFDLDDFKAGNFVPLSEFPDVGRVGTFQTMCLFGQYLYFQEGNAYGVDGNKPPGNQYLGAVRLDGRFVERVFQGADPDLDVREPEAYNVFYGPAGPELWFGYSVGDVAPGRRVLALYKLPLLALPPDRLPVRPLPSRGVFAPGGPIPDVDTVTARIPFAVTANGWVSTTTDEFLMVLDRVHTLVSTQPGERVMRPSYGVPTSQQLFLPADAAKAELEQAISDGVAFWEPTARIVAVDTDVNQQLGLVNVRVQVARADVAPGSGNTAARNVRIGVGGTVSLTPGYTRPPTATG